MNKKLLLLCICTQIATIIYCQLGQMNNRPDYKIYLAVDDELIYEATIKGSQYVIIDSVIQIYPGEKLYVETDIVKNKLTNFRVVPEIIDTNRTLTIKFYQDVVGKKHKQMSLTIDNPFNKQLYYEVLASRLIEKRKL